MHLRCRPLLPQVHPAGDLARYKLCAAHAACSTGSNHVVGITCCKRRTGKHKCSVVVRATSETCSHQKSTCALKGGKLFIPLDPHLAASPWLLSVEDPPLCESLACGFSVSPRVQLTEQRKASQR